MDGHYPKDYIIKWEWIVFQNLSKINKANSIVTTLRNGSMINLHSNDILVGDVIILNQGMVIPADGILMESDDIKIDESSLTGEGKMVRKIHYDKYIEGILQPTKNKTSFYSIYVCYKVINKNIWI